jgi:hypothetical protein
MAKTLEEFRDEVKARLVARARLTERGADRFLVLYAESLRMFYEFGTDPTKAADGLCYTAADLSASLHNALSLALDELEYFRNIYGGQVSEPESRRAATDAVIRFGRAYAPKPETKEAGTLPAT